MQYHQTRWRYCTCGKSEIHESTLHELAGELQLDIDTGAVIKAIEHLKALGNLEATGRLLSIICNC